MHHNDPYQRQQRRDRRSSRFTTIIYRLFFLAFILLILYVYHNAKQLEKEGIPISCTVENSWTQEEEVQDSEGEYSTTIKTYSSLIYTIDNEEHHYVFKGYIAPIGQSKTLYYYKENPNKVFDLDDAYNLFHALLIAFVVFYISTLIGRLIFKLVIRPLARHRAFH